MHRIVFLALIVVALCPPLAAQDKFGLKDETFVVTLLSPLSTKTAQEGDAFTASVDSPEQYQGAVMEGHITKLKRPKNGAGTGKPEIQFQFERLTWNSRTVEVQAALTDVTNSKGVREVDEEGRVIAKTSNKKRIGAAVVGGILGGILGGIQGGAGGAAAGAAAGAGAAFVMALTMTTTGSDMEFQPGSKFTLSVSDGR